MGRSFLLLIAVLLHAAWAAEPAKAVPRLGINLAGCSDWSSEVLFVDVFRASRAWISQRDGQPWGKGPALELDEHGWIKRLEAGCFAETPLCTIAGGHYPSGEYVVLYDGTGRIEFTGAAAVATRAPGRMTLTVEAKRGGFFLQLRETDPADPVRNIRVLLPGHETTYRQEPWNPVVLATWKGFACLRFMDLMHTNGSEIRSWADRPRLEDAHWTRKGVPIEMLCDLANRLEADPWICVPHLADDEYVRKLGALVQAQLSPKRTVWLEFSNEVWNSGFTQQRWAGDRGLELKLHDKHWEACWKFYAKRSVEVFSAWQQGFTDRQRTRRVLASQAANAYVGERILEFENAAAHADVLAIAPYITLNVGPETKPSASDVASWTAARVIEELETRSLPESIRWIHEQKALADRHGLRLVAYEGGQHAVGIQGGENNEQVTAVLHAANRDPAMERIYGAYYAAWQVAGGDLFCTFASVSAFSKWGSWGVMEWQDQDPTQVPKMRACLRWAKSLGQAVIAVER